MSLSYPPKSILFVCLGNICRSPSAQSVMQKQCEEVGLNVVLDSAGVAGYHVGEAPDGRAIEVGRSLGYELSNLRARQVSISDFYEFEMIFAMDNDNLKALQKIMPTDAIAYVRLFDDKAVADPYYGDKQDFEQMFAHIIRAGNGWISRWQGGL